MMYASSQLKCNSKASENIKKGNQLVNKLIRLIFTCIAAVTASHKPEEKKIIFDFY